MGLPGITRSQIVEVDRIMMEEYRIPVELMMEHAGSILARLVLKLFPEESSIFQVIAGSGNNGGGGLVAARRLASWGMNTEIYLPKGINKLREIPKHQLSRAKGIGVKIIEGLPSETASGEAAHIIFDAYTGYNFRERPDKTSDKVFTYMSEKENVISLDTPSDLNVTSGEDLGGVHPKATLTIAFVKRGLLIANKAEVGDLYVADIGVPTNVYRNRLNIEWYPPFNINDLGTLDFAFRYDPLQRIIIKRNKKSELNSWRIQGN